jgi:hypothetical protein
MAKSDVIEVLVQAAPRPHSLTITATKAGRTVRTRDMTRAGIKWLVAEEITKSGKPSGTSFRVRVDMILCISEVRVEEVKRPPRKPKVEMLGLPLFVETDQ